MRAIKIIIAGLMLLSFFSCKKKTVNINNPVPSITSISPNSATAGDPSFILTVNGNNFVNGSVIRWNNIGLMTSFVSNNRITANVSDSFISLPAVDTITIFNPGINANHTDGGVSNKMLFVCSAGSSQSNPSPVVTSLSPASITAGSAGFTLTVTGNNFINSSIVRWNGNNLSTTYVNSNQLTTTVSASLVVSAGNAAVTVFTPTPGGGISNSLNFTVSAVGNNPVPTLTSISPASITAGSAGFTLTATGTNFMNGSAVNWNNTALTTTYVSATQLTATISTSLVANAGTANVIVVNPIPGGGTTIAKTFTINSQGAATKKFLFDATKAETAGNADWVIDEDNNTPQKTPTPLQSTVTGTTVETYWTGALSSWGIALAKLGHKVETLPSSGSITYGNSNNVQDLSNYDVFVVDEPNTRFTTAEKQAILNFINNGGGLFMVSDHTQSDRNNDGYDSPDIWNDLMTNNGIVNNPFGFSIDLTNISGTSSNVLTGNSSNVILHGSQGNVTQLDFNNGATLTINSSVNSSVKGLVWESGYAQSTTHVISASSTYGTGRVFVVADSSPLDDGTGGTGNILYVGWPLYSHTQLFMNASLWLAKLQ